MAPQVCVSCSRARGALSHPVCARVPEWLSEKKEMFKKMIVVASTTVERRAEGTERKEMEV